MSDTSQVRPELIRIIAEQAMISEDDIKDSSTLDDIGLDSLGIVEAVFAIEETFDIQVPFNANNPEESEFDVSNVGAMIRAVEDLVAKKA